MTAWASSSQRSPVRIEQLFAAFEILGARYNSAESLRASNETADYVVLNSFYSGGKKRDIWLYKNGSTGIQTASGAINIATAWSNDNFYIGGGTGYSLIDRDSFNCGDFGGKVDGATDDASFLSILGNYDGTAELEDGTITIGSQITLSKIKNFRGKKQKTKIATTAGFTDTNILSLAPPASTDSKNWEVGAFQIENNGSATNAILLDVSTASAYLNKLILNNIVSTKQTAIFCKLLNSIPNADGLFSSLICDNWSFGGYELINVGDSVNLLRNTTTGAGTGYKIQQLGTASNIRIADGNCTSADNALSIVKGANITFDNMQCESPLTAGVDTFAGVNSAMLSIHNATDLVYNTKIINNNINTKGAVGRCIYVGNSDLTLIEGNQLRCDPASEAHIYIDSGARNVIIGNNKYYSSVTGAEIDPIITVIAGAQGVCNVWQTATLSSWTTLIDPTNGFAAGYCKSRDGIVQLRGNLTGTASTAGQQLFTLPIGMRPKLKTVFLYVPMLISGSVVLGQIFIPSTGVVQFGVANATKVYLDGIQFSTL